MECNSISQGTNTDLCVNRRKENVTKDYILKSVLVLGQFKCVKGRKKKKKSYI